MKRLRASCSIFSICVFVLLGAGCGGQDIKCKDVTCDADASCDPDTGACVCDPGYAGAACDECAEGYHAETDACLADECATDADCDDGLVCTGAETCRAGQCQAGAAIECAEHAGCTEPGGECACEPGYLAQGDGCLAYLSILGSWSDDWGYAHDVSREAWITGDSVFHLSLVDAEAGYLVAQNDDANPWSPGLWSKFEWGWGGDLLYYCQIAYAAASQEEAAVASADRSSLGTGCGGFPWSRLHPRPEIVGAWVDEWGYDHDITRDTWTTAGSVFHITKADNPDSFLVAHNDPANLYSPGLWSRFDWTRDANDDLYYCQVAYDAADQAAAEASPGADRGDLAGGCAGFGWSALSPR